MLRDKYYTLTAYQITAFQWDSIMPEYKKTYRILIMIPAISTKMDFFLKVSICSKSTSQSYLS